MMSSIPVYNIDRIPCTFTSNHYLLVAVEHGAYPSKAGETKRTR